MNCYLLSHKVVRFALFYCVVIDGDAVLLKIECLRMVVFSVVLCFIRGRFDFDAVCFHLDFVFVLCSVLHSALFAVVLCIALHCFVVVIDGAPVCDLVFHTLLVACARNMSERCSFCTLLQLLTLCCA